MYLRKQVLLEYQYSNGLESIGDQSFKWILKDRSLHFLYSMQDVFLMTGINKLGNKTLRWDVLWEVNKYYSSLPGHKTRNYADTICVISLGMSMGAHQHQIIGCNEDSLF